MGYKALEMPGSKKAKEDVLASTYYQLRGKNFEIDIEMNCPGKFKQVLTDADGT